MKASNFFSLALAFVIVTACSRLHAANPDSPPPAVQVQVQGDRLTVPAGSPLRTRVVVSAVGAQAGRHLLSVPAVVEGDPALVVAIVPPLTGRLLKLHVGLGDIVRRGQPLADIGSPDFGQAVADEAKAADALDLANRVLQRARGVQEAGANAGKDIEAAEIAQRDAVSEERRSHDRIATLAGGARVDPRTHALVVLAPISGVVTALNVGAGAFLGDATAALMTVTDLDRVFVTALLPESALASVAPGSPVEVTLSSFPGEVFLGKAGRINPVLEPDTRRAKLRIPFANAEGRLRPNMFATATFPLQEPDGVTVPTSALLMNNDSITVLVEVSPWTFVRRTVELGAEDGSVVRILKGLSKGERVVVRGGVLLND